MYAAVIEASASTLHRLCECLLQLHADNVSVPADCTTAAVAALAKLSCHTANSATFLPVFTSIFCEYLSAVAQVCMHLSIHTHIHDLSIHPN